MKLSSLLKIYYSGLGLFTSFVLLMEFVIPHGGVVISTSSSSTSTPTSSVSSSSSYSYNNIPSLLRNATVIGEHEDALSRITVYTFRAHSSTFYVADILANSHTTYQNAFAFNRFGGKNYVQNVSTMAEEHNAVLAMNSDYASHYDTGLVIRNGQILRTTNSARDALVMWNDGTLSTLPDASTTADALLAAGAWHVWSFGPVLIKDGIMVADATTGLSRNQVDNPRSAIGMVDANHMMFISVDGRTSISQGVDVEELADVMMDLGITEGFNFDGGGSATLWFDGEVINKPSDGQERGVGDCVYIPLA